MSVMSFVGILLTGLMTPGASAAIFALCNLGVIGELVYQVLKNQETRIAEMESKQQVASPTA